MKSKPAPRAYAKDALFLRFCWRMAHGPCICAEIPSEERPCLACNSRAEIRQNSIGFA